MVDIKLILTDEQLTALINILKPNKLPVTKIRIKFDSGKIVANAVSYNPRIPGDITVVSNLKLNHFYVKEVYIGRVQAPKRVSTFVEANLDGLIAKSFQEYDVFVKSMRMEGDKLVFKASVPKGMISVDGKTIKVNQNAAPKTTTPEPTSDVRY